ncbi:MAG TPA: CopD family protein, partial [Trinickia sp.]|nr:CopD family protein [Trinickia sp.]
GRGPNRVVAWIGLLASAVFMASLAWAGHGAAADDVPYDALHLPADILHLLASGAWLGALPMLVLLLFRAWRSGSHERVLEACAATKRFSVLGITCVGTLLVTGVVNTWFLAGSAAALLGTQYGQLLLLKIAFFVGMVGVAGINQRRLLPCLADVDRDAAVRLRAVRQVSRNASIEAGLGVLVLGVVGVIGVLPPGLHTEPQWPLPFRIDYSEIAVGRQTFINIAAWAFVCALAVVGYTLDRKRYRAMVVSVACAVLIGCIGGVALVPAIVQAYPTSFYASPQAYAAPSIARGAPLYAANCIVCHGVGGRGDGPLAGKLPIRPADLTESHLFAHKVGEMFWWVSNGRDNGVMPGFSDKLTPDQRWDLINFLLARAAGDGTRVVGSQIGTTAAVPLPDFAFEQGGAQNTLSQMVKGGPVLVVLFTAHAPATRLAELAKAQPQFNAAGLHVIAVGIGKGTNSSPLSVEVSDDVRAMLGLFRTDADGGETELMLDRGGNVRARWTAGGAGLADVPTLLNDAVTVAKIPVAAANHAGHGH